MKQILLILIILYLTPLHSISQGVQILRAGDTIMLSQPNVGQKMRPFTCKIKDKTISDGSLIGKVTFINFWFSDCLPCMTEMSELNSLYRKFAKDKRFTFLSFTFESEEEIKRIKNTYQLLFEPIHISSDSCSYLNYESGFPTNMVVSPKGQVVLLKAGGSVDSLFAKSFFEHDITPVIIQTLDTMASQK